MQTDEARDLLAYNEWANARLVTVIDALPDEAFTKPVTSSFGSLRDTLAHLIGAEWAWLKRWAGDSPTSWPGWLKEAGRAALLPKLAEVQAERAAFAAGLTDAQLAAPLAYRSFGGQSYENRLGDLIRHVVNHSTYHRGQAATQLRHLGVVPPSTDFVVYCRETR
jgi:uncharacterized damage-inducible protein DinB